MTTSIPDHIYDALFRPLSAATTSDSVLGRPNHNRTLLRAMLGPGLGITINEKLVRARSTGYTQDAWRNPQWRGEDASLREW